MTDTRLEDLRIDRGPSGRTRRRTLPWWIKWAVVIVVKRLEPQYRIFALTNGILWGAVALVGWTLPDFHGLDAFNRIDTILHTIVSVTGLASVVLTKQV